MGQFANGKLRRLVPLIYYSHTVIPSSPPFQCIHTRVTPSIGDPWAPVSLDDERSRKVSNISGSKILQSFVNLEKMACMRSSLCACSSSENQKPKPLYLSCTLRTSPLSKTGVHQIAYASSAGLSYSNMGWAQVPTFYFTAISPQTTLTLASSDVTTSSCGPVVDNIVIRAGEPPWSFPSSSR
jgi:hypothetical protein